MFSKVFTITCATAVAVVALPRPSDGACPEGSLVCCNDIGEVDLPSVTVAIEPRGVSAQAVDDVVDAGCVPIPDHLPFPRFPIPSCPIGKPVCCQGSTFNGLVNTDCTPVPVPF